MNEIAAIPQLLETLELHGAIVSINAMGCQAWACDCSMVQNRIPGLQPGLGKLLGPWPEKDEPNKESEQNADTRL